MLTATQLSALAWEKMNGLLPCTVQDALTGKVLMLGYMNKAAAEHSVSSGLVTFYSRSKERLWTKGESSGHTLTLVELSADCDQDALLALAIPNGPTCHLGTESCWQTENDPASYELGFLQRTILQRAAEPAAASYTAKLLADGVRRCAQKVGEEGVEVALAAVAQDDQALLNESADLLYHLLVVLAARDLSLADVTAVLKARRKP